MPSPHFSRGRIALAPFFALPECEKALSRSRGPISFGSYGKACYTGCARFEDFVTFLYVFMSVVKVLVCEELWVNLPVAIFFPMEDWRRTRHMSWATANLCASRREAENICHSFFHFELRGITKLVIGLGEH